MKKKYIKPTIHSTQLSIQYTILGLSNQNPAVETDYKGPETVIEKEEGESPTTEGNDGEIGG